MKQSLRLAVAAAAMGMAATASAGYFEIGAEIEDYNGLSGDETFYLPYVIVGGNPIEGSSFSAELKTSQRMMDDYGSRSSSNRHRNDITIGYTFQYGDFTFNPRYRQRHNFLASGAREYEHRFFPNMSYRLNDTFSVQLDGFVAPVQKKNQAARGTDTAERNDYTDYKHEFDMRLNTQISDSQRLTVSIYNEYSRTSDLSKAEAANDDDKTRNANEWQLRLVYTQNFGDFSLTPFARIGLSKKDQTVDGTKKDLNRHRFGIAGSYKLTNDLSLVGETYFQTQKQQDYDAGQAIEDRSDKNYMFYKVGVRYSF